MQIRRRTSSGARVRRSHSPRRSSRRGSSGSARSSIGNSRLMRLGEVQPPRVITPLVSVPRTRRSPSVRTRPPHRASGIPYIVIGLALVGLAAGALAALRTCRAGASPPALARLGPLAPEVEDIVRQAGDGVAEDPRDGARWGRFGMVCEANGLAGAARGAYTTATTLQSAEPKWWF